MITLGAVIQHARRQLQDTRENNYRHSTAKLYNLLNMALWDARRLRPDLFAPGSTAVDFDYTETDIAVTLPCDSAYVSALVDHIAGTVSLEEDEYVADGRAAALLSRFTGKLVGKGV